MAEIQVCIHCWIPVRKESEGNPIVGGSQQPPLRWIHKATRSDTGNPFCGRQFLEDEEVDSVSSVDE